MYLLRLALVPLLFVFAACEDTDPETPTPSVNHPVEAGCYAVEGTDLISGEVFALERASGDASFAFTGISAGLATPFQVKPAGLGRYLLRDELDGHLVSDGEALLRTPADELLSDIRLVDDDYESPAVWRFEGRSADDSTLHLYHDKSRRLASAEGMTPLVVRALSIDLVARSGCSEFPEADLNATGEVETTTWPDGDLYGFVDTHSHILSNFGFGGAGIFHGHPFHELGIEHALGDCEPFHGEMGRQDLFGFGFDAGSGLDPDVLLASFATGTTPEDNHETDGWPTFTDWPNAPFSSTHQVQYWRWVERAWLGGLRLVVLHATTNQIICDILVAPGTQPGRYACNDMVGVDRIIDESWAMQDYIDAQAGGEGQGFFRIVTSPEEARDVIRDGKLAVVLGIETSNLFDCFENPLPPFEACSEQDVVDALDGYHDRGVRALFPVHKYDNGFSAGDGSKEIIELGNFFQTGDWNDFVTDCPDVNTTFDRGTVGFLGINRSENEGPPPDLSNFSIDPVGTVTQPEVIGPLFAGGAGSEEVCQATGLTPLGEFLIDEMMSRGMILEIDHLPRRSYQRAFEMMEAADYPAAGTHGLNNGGDLYALGGVSKSGFGTCHNETTPATVDDGWQNRIALIEASGGYPAEGFGLDLNGFAGARGPRFGDDSGCSNQVDPITYPFTSYAGDVTFEEPTLGDRTLDFNTEGLAHLGLVPELIQDVLADGVTKEELEPLFRSAEGYVRMWEKSEERGRALAP